VGSRRRRRRGRGRGRAATICRNPLGEDERNFCGELQFP